MDEKQEAQGIDTKPTHITAAQLAERWHCSEGTLAYWRCSGDAKGPRFIKMGRRVLYLLEDVELIEQRQIKETETDPGTIDTKRNHLTAAQLAERWACAESTLSLWRCSGDPKGPRFIKLGRKVLYPIVEVERVERERLQRATHVKDADAR